MGMRYYHLAIGVKKINNADNPMLLKIQSNRKSGIADKKENSETTMQNNSKFLLCLP